VVDEVATVVWCIVVVEIVVVDEVTMMRDVVEVVDEDTTGLGGGWLVSLIAVTITHAKTRATKTDAMTLRSIE